MARYLLQHIFQQEAERLDPREEPCLMAAEVDLLSLHSAIPYQIKTMK